MRISLQQAAEILGKSARTVRKWIRDGKLPATKSGGTWSIDRDQLPLSVARRRELEARVEQINGVVADLLPSRVASTSNDRKKRLLDRDVVTSARAFLGELAGRSNATAPSRAEAPDRAPWDGDSDDAKAASPGLNSATSNSGVGSPPAPTVSSVAASSASSGRCDATLSSCIWMSGATSRASTSRSCAG